MPANHSGTAFLSQSRHPWGKKRYWRQGTKILLSTRIKELVFICGGNHHLVSQNKLIPNSPVFVLLLILLQPRPWIKHSIPGEVWVTPIPDYIFSLVIDTSTLQHQHQHQLHIKILAVRLISERWAVGAGTPVIITLNMLRNWFRIVFLLAFVCKLNQIWLYF